MRLGQRLIQDGLITSEQLEHGLRTQAERGGRLGSNLVDLGHLDADILARYLGRQHGMPPALAQHFAHRDPVLPTRLPAALAARWGVIPIAALTGDRKQVAVAVIDPLPAAAIEQIAAALGCEIITAMAAETQVHQALEHIYGIAHAALPARPPRPRSPILVTGEDTEYEIELHLARDIERPIIDDQSATDSASIPPLDALPLPPTVEHAALRGPTEDSIELDLDADINDALDGEAAAAAPGPRQQPHSDGVPQEIGDADSSEATNPVAVAKLGRISLRRRTASPANASLPPAPAGPARTLEETRRAMRRAMGRDRVGDLVVQALRDLFGGIFDAGAILVLRGTQVVGWKGFVRNGSGRALPKVAMPVDATSTIGSTFRTFQPFVGSLHDGGTQADRHLWNRLGTEPPHTVAVAPVVVETQLACVLYAQTSVDATRAIPIVGNQLTDLAEATASAFERLIRAARR